MSTRVRQSALAGPSVVRWGAVFSGTVIGLGLSLLAGTLWAAFAFGSHDAAFYNHLAWWFAGTAIGGMFVAALLAGLVSGTRGAASGLANGLTAWGLVVIAAIGGGLPGLAAYGTSRPITVNGIRVAVTTVRPWPTFWALLIGLGAAVIGGVLGGMMRRKPMVPAEVPVVPAAPVDVRDEPRLAPLPHTTTVPASSVPEPTRP